MNLKIANRQNKEKQLLLEQFKKTPIIQVACEKTGVGRATYYRWRKEDELFADNADRCISEGVSLLNDMTESQLINAIKEKNLGAIIFWLKNRHPAYATKVAVTAELKHNNETLTPEQEALVTKALEIASLIPGRNQIKEVPIPGMVGVEEVLKEEGEE